MQAIVVLGKTAESSTRNGKRLRPCERAEARLRDGEGQRTHPYILLSQANPPRTIYTSHHESAFLFCFYVSRLHSMYVARLATRGWDVRDRQISAERGSETERYREVQM